ncbi:Ig-like domain-containing protein [Actomonas aquatica]|uniref:Ig-like domain-containing protein n=1 Tax=Actomonas aquatica TaxID=2866162 RepID=A0ABZ1C226_9BACT|nr:Ig-like domain-containing protein [Opitutus sp. WL0086]WRQ85723.1 Ig-like domain-containing protein [Opitutus sp. WL0086]
MLLSFLVGLSAPLFAQADDPVAQVRHAPQINGQVEGSVQMMLGEWMNMNSGAQITGELRVPGSPQINQNGSPEIGLIVDADGSAAPSNYGITINSGSSIGGIVRRVDAVALPTVSAPPNPTGNRYVNLNNGSESPGDFATLRNLNLNSGVGNVTVPAGTYGDFAANSGAGFVLGVPGATEPAIYHFQCLTLNSNSVLSVVGPVIVTVRYDLNLNALAGNPANPSWLKFRVHSGGLNDNSGAVLYGFIEAPNGTVNINGRVVGGVVADRLTVNSGGVLELRAAAVPNQLPVAVDVAIATDEDAPVAVGLLASDADGDALLFTVVDAPTGGVLSGAAPGLTYTPATNFNGTDSFTYRASDGAGDSNLATVTISVAAVNDAPTADDVSASLDEDTTVAVSLSGDDVDGDTLSFAVADAPSFGVLSGAGGTLTYTPDPNFHGTDSFTYTSSDGALTSAAATVSLLINPINDAPVAGDLTLAVDEGDTLAFVLPATDVDGDALSYELLTAPVLGAVSGTLPDLDYAPNANTNGVETITYRVFDGSAYSEVGAVTISITNLNDVPTAHAQTINSLEDTAVEFTLTGSDPDGDSLSFAIDTQPVSGSLTLVGAQVSYSPFANFAGEDAFSFTVSDGSLVSMPATVTLVVQSVNDLPVAEDLAIVTNEDNPADVELVANDADGDALSYTVVDAPTSGGLSGTAPGLTYTPAANFNGTDSFTYRASDGAGDSNLATFTITVAAVNDAPTADDVSASLDEDTPVAVSLSGNDVDGDTLSFAVADAPSFGVLSGAGDTLTYTPDPNFHGADSFTYTSSDGALTSSVATVSLVIHPINDAPVASDLTLAVDEGDTLAITLPATDVDGDVLSFAIIDAPILGTLDGTAPDLTYTPPANTNGTDVFTFRASDGSITSNVGTVTLAVSNLNDAPSASTQAVTTLEDTAVEFALSGSDPDGDSLSFVIATAPISGAVVLVGSQVTYTPLENFYGEDTFTVTASDGQLESAPATITVTVQPVNDVPVAASQRVELAEDDSAAIPLVGTDIDGDALAYVIVDAPTHGTLSGTAPDLTYTPAANYHGGDTFTFVVNDGSADSNVATVELVVASVNDAPAADDLTVSTSEDVALAIELSGVDVDDGDVLTFAILEGPAHGTLVLVGTTATYTPTPDFNGGDSFTYLASDALLDSTPATVTLIVTPGNDLPVAAGQSVSTDEDTSVAFTLTGSDIDGDALSYTVIEGPTHGSLSGTAPALSYTPEANFAGPDAFTFVVNDGTVDSAPATVAITVTAVNDAPSVAAAEVELDEDSAVVVELATFDAEGDALTLTVVTPPVHGTLSGDPFAPTYTPDEDYYGTDEFVITVNDGQADSAPALIALTILPINDAPVVEAATLAATEDEPLTFTLTATDIEDDPLTFTITAGPTNGALSVDAAGELTYTPTANFNGTDSFVVVANDGELDSAETTITIEVAPVNDVPAADDQSVTTAEDTSLPITLTGTDIDGDGLTYVIDANPAYGSLSGIAPNVSYTPNPDFNGSDAFAFRVTDGESESAPAIVSIQITPTNDAPIASAQTVDALEDTAVAITLAGIDVDGDVLTYVVIDGPTVGTLSGVAPDLTYIPSPNANGSDSFTFQVSDGSLISAPASITIEVAPVNDAPAAISQGVTTFQNTPVSLTLTASDLESDPLTFLVVAQPEHGVLSGTAPALTYSPEPGFSGSDSFAFLANDGVLDSDPGVVTIMVAAPNQPPTVDAGLDATAAVGTSTEISPYGNIILNHDEWTLTEEGFAASPYAGLFAQNMAHWFTGGRPGRFLAYTDTVPGSVDFAYTGDSLKAALEADGHEWVVSSEIPFTLETLLEFDAVFLAANDVDNAILIQYVEGGGSVYISAGTKWCGCDAHVEASWYNDFLEYFGLAYSFPYNGVSGTLAVNSDHPIFEGIETLFYQNGNPVIVIDPDDPLTSVVNRYQERDLMALYSRSAVSASYTLQGSVIDDGLPAPGQLSYQWTLEDGPGFAFIEDPDAATSLVSMLDPGTYRFRLTVSDGEFEVFDEVEILVEINEPPLVYAGPDEVVSDLSDSIRPQAVVTDDGLPRGNALAVEWRILGNAAAVVFSDTNSIQPEIAFTQAGLHVLKLSATDGQEERSDLAEFRIGFRYDALIPNDAVAWWPLNGSNLDVVSNHILGGTRDAIYVPGKVGLGYDFGTRELSRTVKASADLDLGVSEAGFTIELWVNPSRTQDVPLVLWANEGSEGLSLRQWNNGRGLYAELRPTSGSSLGVQADNVFTANTWTHVAVTYDRVTGRVRLYRNGVMILDQAQAANLRMQTTYDLQIGSLRRENRYFQGVLDEIALYGRPLSAAEIAAIHASGAQGKPPLDGNLAPVVYAGADQSITTLSTTLTGTVSDDGEPAGSALTVGWALVEGPAGATVIFGDASSASTSVSFSEAGTYLLQLDADDGLLQATPDVVLVRADVVFDAAVPTDMAAWWPGNGDPHEQINGGHDVELLQGAGYGTGQVSQGFTFDGVNDHGRITKHADLDLGVSEAGFTIELWVNPSRTQDVPLVLWANEGSEGLSLRQWNNGRGLYAELRPTSGSSLGVQADNVFTANTWTHVAVTYDRVTGRVRLYRNGVMILDQAQAANLRMQTTYDLQIGSLRRENRYFQGVLDEIALYGRPLSAAEIAAIHASGAQGKPPLDGNLAPVVYAGADQSITTLSTTLTGTVSDDGEPAGSALTVGWALVEGPAGATVIFGDASSASTSVSFSEAGTYLLQLDADDGLLQATPDVVLVRADVVFDAAVPTDMAAWWPGNGDPHEQINGGHDVELLQGAGYGTGQVSQGFTFDGVNDHGRITKHADLDLGVSEAGFTIELWVNPSRTQDVPLVLWANEGSEGLSLRQWNNGRGLYAELRPTSGSSLGVQADNVFTANTWTHVAVTYDRVTGRVRLYRNGVMILDQAQAANLRMQTTYDLQIGSLRRENRYFQGVLDEIALYGRPLSAAEIAAIHASGAQGKPPLDGNLAPVVYAGADQSITTLSTTLTGTVSDDGEPAGSALTVGWALVEGPAGATVIFGDASSASTSVSFSEAGTYLLQLDADDGLLQATPDVVLVRADVVFDAAVPTDMAAWWPGNGDPHEQINGGHDVELLQGAGYGTGQVSQGFTFDGVNDHGRITKHADLDLGVSEAGFTIELWVNPSRTQDVPLVLWANEGSEGLSLRQWNNGRGLYAELRPTSGSSLGVQADNVFTANTWTHVAVTYDRVTGRVRLYRNGVMILDQAQAANLRMQTTYDLQIGSLRRENRYFQGVLDEIALYGRPLSAAEIAAIHASGAQGKPPLDGNLAPVVYAGADQSITTLSTTLTGTVSDDGEPAGSALTVGWALVEGPAGATVIFGDASSASTSVSFSEAGTYLLQLDADDGLLQATPDVVLVRADVVFDAAVPTDMAAWWPGNGDPHEQINGGHDVELLQGAGYGTGQVSQGFTFDGVNDHGRITKHADLDLGVSEAGFTIELWVNPSRTQDVPLVLWANEGSEGLSLRQWNNGRGLYAELRPTSGSSLGVQADNVFTANTWTHVAVTYDRVTGRVRLYRNGVMILDQAQAANLRMQTTYDLQIGSLRRENRYFQGVLDEIALYGRPLSAAEIAAIHASGAQGKPPVLHNVAPFVVASEPRSAFVGVPVSAAILVADDGLPDPPAALTYLWTKQSGPGLVAVSDPAIAEPSFTFDTAGTYVLRLTVDDGELSAFDEVTVEVAESPDGTPPSITIFEPADGNILLADTYFEIAAVATDDVAIAKVEFFNGAEKLGEQTLPSADEPDVFFWPLTNGLSAGSYTFTAVATDNAGFATTSPEISITVSDDPDVVGAGAFIASPAEDSRISAPTEVSGVISSGSLQSWNLEYRLRPSGDDTSGSAEPWISVASGIDPVGTAATGESAAVPDVIGIFDPTLLLNGIYELRLVVASAGGTTTYGPLAVVVDGNMKIGAFSIAFEDLSVPTPGIPISITRTYDSRDQRVGDFGPGWWIAVGNVRVQKNRNLGTAWWQTPQSGDGIQFYDVLPIDERIVTIAMPDGETHRFRAGALVKNRPGDPDYRSFASIVREGLYKFYPLGDTTATLEPIDATGVLAEQFWIDGTGDQDLYLGEYGDFDYIPFNPTRFRLTTSDGTVMILDEQLGLLEMHDLTGNELTLGRDANQRIDTITSAQVTDTDPIERTVSIVRDATGRVDYIEDLVGRQIDYLYDTEGRLESVTDRELDTTQFFYENPNFPTYLTRILDPRGLPALRSEYDGNGRLKKQIDADGKETIFDRGIDATGRFETITDRLGNPTTYYYDERGNITTQLDAMGAVTEFSYYPDSDRERLRIDHYGNVTSMAYDARGNVTVETIGADATEDAATPTIGYTTRTSYNSRSAPLFMTDPDGRVQSFTYDPVTNDLLTHTVGYGTAEAATTTYTYNADGTLDTITDALLTVTDTDYDYGYSDASYPTATQLVTTTVTDAEGTVLRSTRSILDAQQNQLAQIVTRTLLDGSSEDIVTAYRFDAENRLVATILPDGRVMEMRYTSFGAEAASVQSTSVAAYEAGDDSAARITSMDYDDRGNVVATTYPDGTSERAGFDAEGRRIWTQDRRGYRTFMVYDAVGRQRFTLFPDDNDGIDDAAPTSADDPRLADNPRTETVYDLVGRVTDTYDELGNRTEFVYEDGCSCFQRRKQSIQHLATGNLTTGYQYDNAGNVTHITDPRGNTTETRYDEQGRPYLVIHPATDEHPVTQTETFYDALGRRVAVSDQEGKLTRYRYDGLGRLVEVRQYLDQSLVESDFDFSLPPSTADLVSTRYAYDEAGNQTTQTDALGRVTTYATDALGRRLTRTLPSDPANGVAEVSEVLDYDEWGNLWHRTDFAGHTTTFGYDTLNRLKTKTADVTHPSLIHSHAIARIEYDYDDNGARTAARTYNASDVQLYAESTPRDERGRLDYKDTAAGRLDYGYYANGLLQDVVSSNADGVNIGYRYDDANRLAYVDDASTGVPAKATAYTYNDNGSLETVATPNGVTHTYTYDTLNRLRTLNVTVAAVAGVGDPGSASSLHHYTYALRASGHRQSVTEGPAPSGPFKVTTYAYDDLYRLRGETVTGSATAAELGTVTYDLDKVGNRLTRLSSIPAVTDQSSTYNVRDWLDSDTYDANGNTLNSDQLATRYPLLATTSDPDVYDFEDRLIVRARSDGSSVIVAYDADGLRRQKLIVNSVGTVGRTTSYLVDTNNLTGYAQVFEERTSAVAGGGDPGFETTTKVYTYGNDLISQATLPPAASTFDLNYYVYDGGGTVRELTDESGSITVTYVYDAFGIIVTSVGLTENSYLYRGEQWDPDAGLYYLRARFMNPENGRFWNSDIFEGFSWDPYTLHKYSYTHHDPVGYVDYSGRSSIAVELQAAQTISLFLRAALAVVSVYALYDAYENFSYIDSVGSGRRTQFYEIVGEVEPKPSPEPKPRPGPIPWLPPVDEGGQAGCEMSRVPSRGGDRYHDQYAASLQGGVSAELLVIAQDNEAYNFDAATPFVGPNLAYEAKTRHGFLNNDGVNPRVLTSLEAQFSRASRVSSSCNLGFQIAVDNQAGYQGLKKHFPQYPVRLIPYSGEN